LTTFAVTALVKAMKAQTFRMVKLQLTLLVIIGLAYISEISQFFVYLPDSLVGISINAVYLFFICSV